MTVPSQFFIPAVLFLSTAAFASLPQPLPFEDLNTSPSRMTIVNHEESASSHAHSKTNDIPSSTVNWTKVTRHLKQFALSKSEITHLQDTLRTYFQQNSELLASHNSHFIAQGLWRIHQAMLTFKPITPSDHHLLLTAAVGRRLALKQHQWLPHQFDAVVFLSSGNPYLTQIDLFRCHIDDAAMKQLAQLSHLQDLNLEENDVTDTGTIFLAQMPHLKKLKLWKNKITSQGAEILTQSSSLQELGLYKNPIGNQGAVALSKSQTLTSLDLREANIGDEGALALAANQTLQTLRLRYNQITDQGGQAFLKNQTLVHLEVDRNNLSKELKVVLEGLMPGHGYLRTLQTIPAVLPLPQRQKIRILSIDGGGIRGLMAALVLDAIAQKVSAHTHTPFHFAHHVDMMAGTSTGGIICAALATPDDKSQPCYLPKTLVDLYHHEGSKIFPSSWNLLKNLGHVKYQPEPLESKLAEYFGTKRLSSALTHVLITAFDLSRNKAHIFDSRVARHRLGKDYELKGVTRATSAAPTYFPAACITNAKGKVRTFVDGGIYANNPTLLALKTAQQLYPHAQEYVVISVGTGVNPRPADKSSTLKGAGLIKWGINISDTLMNNAAQYTENLLQQECAHDQRIRYYRIQPHLQAEETAMDKTTHSHLQRLTHVAKLTLQQHESALNAIIADFCHDFGQVDPQRH